MTTPAETLYTIKTTLKDFHRDPSGALQQVQIAGTYTSLISAKEAAKTALYTLGYSTEDLPTYDIKSPSNVESWTFGDGVLVHAVAPSKEELLVEIETCPNILKIHSVGKDGKVEDKLSYVLQTSIHYDVDASGAKRETTIEGIYTSRPDAIKAANKTLLEDGVVGKKSYAEWDEFSGQKDWSFGENVYIHAVAENGQNFEVSVVEGGQKFSTTDSA
jgi:hypothetical protein